MKKWTCLHGAAACVIFSATAHGQASEYFLDKINPPTGYSNFTPAAITDTGYTGGNIKGSGSTAAALVKGGKAEIMKGMGYNYAPEKNDVELAAVNSSGAAAGKGYNASGYQRATYWDTSGMVWELIPPTGSQDANSMTWAVGISENHVVAGTAYTNTNSSDDFSRAMIWKSGYTSDAVALDHCHVDGYDNEVGLQDYAAAISSNGVYVTGTCTIPPSGDWDGVLWKNGKIVTDLQIFTAFDHAYPRPQSVNSMGNSVGVGDDCFPNNPAYPFCPDTALYWDTHGKATDLGVLPNMSIATASSVARWINDSGVVVGEATANDNAVGRAVMWDARHKITDLSLLMAAQLPSGTQISNASQITNDGKILVALSNSKTGALVGNYQLTPVIPTTIRISSSHNPSSYGQQVQILATLLPTSGSSVPKSYVKWYDNGKLVNEAALSTYGQAQYLLSTLAPGKHAFTASYGGYSPNGAATSPVFTQTVNASSTKTTMAASSTSVTHGASFSLTATVTPAYGTIAGKVTFKAGSTTLGTATVDGRTRQAKLTTSIKTSGKYSITAAFGASTDFAASTSSAVSVTIK